MRAARLPEARYAVIITIAVLMKLPIREFSCSSSAWVADKEVVLPAVAAVPPIVAANKQHT